MPKKSFFAMCYPPKKLILSQRPYFLDFLDKSNLA